MATSISFSQNDTPIAFKPPIAKLIIKDLIEGDNAKKEVIILSDKLVLQGLTIQYKDSINLTLSKKNLELQEIIGIKDQQLLISNELTNKLNTDLKKVMFKNKMFNISFVGVLVVGVGILVVTSI